MDARANGAPSGPFLPGPGEAVESVSPRDSPKPPRPEDCTIRLLSLASSNYLDDAPPARAHRTFVLALSRAGFAVEVLTGSTLAAGAEVDLPEWASARGRIPDDLAIARPPDIPPPPWPQPASHLRLDVA